MFSLEQLSGILSTLPDPLFILTRTGHYAGIFGASDSHYCYVRSNLVGKSIRDVLNTKKADWFIRQIQNTLAINELQVVQYNLSENDVKGENNIGSDNVIWFEGRIQALNFPVDGEDAVLWVESNMTLKHELEKGLITRSETDKLTGLWNRSYFEQAVSQELKRAIRYRSAISLLILNIDYFKLINDTHGHKIGDSVLCEMASLIDSCTRKSDVVLRWGGDEFALLMPFTDLIRARNVAEKVCKTIKNHLFKRDQKITVSVGCTEWYFEKEPIEHLISNADKALSLAKNKGRNRIQYFE